MMFTERGLRQMGYYENLQKSVDWMEANLGNDVSLGQIASSAGYSVPHFYRVFSAMAGMTASEYLRKRRLSRTQPELFERISIIAMKKEGTIIMKPRIILKGPRTLTGFARDMTQGENIRLGLIGFVQKEFEKEAERVPGRVGADLHYAAYDYKPEDIAKDDDEIAYTYYYCVESDSQPPEGMVRKEIPCAKYAEFVWDPKANTLNGEAIGMHVYDYIDGVWLPASGFELAELPDYEVHDKETGLVEINISVK
jgi:AraC family transcriptional regulator